MLTLTLYLRFPFGLTLVSTSLRVLFSSSRSHSLHLPSYVYLLVSYSSFPCFIIMISSVISLSLIPRTLAAHHTSKLLMWCHTKATGADSASALNYARKHISAFNTHYPLHSLNTYRQVSWVYVAGGPVSYPCSEPEKYTI